jgi:hypothetical protein
VNNLLTYEPTQQTSPLRGARTARPISAHPLQCAARLCRHPYPKNFGRNTTYVGSARGTRRVVLILLTRRGHYRSARMTKYGFCGGNTRVGKERLHRCTARNGSFMLTVCNAINPTVLLHPSVSTPAKL